MAVKLCYHPHLYLGESINEKKLNTLKRRLENRPLFTGIYLITLSRNSSDQLEIYQSKQLSLKYYRNHPPLIIGLASDYEEAIQIIMRIVTDCLNERGNCLLKEFLLCGK